MPSDANYTGDIFGGWLMAHMDLGASTLAHRRANGRVATVAVDGMSFLSPVFVGDEVTMYAGLVSTGRSSISLQWRRSPLDRASGAD